MTDIEGGVVVVVGMSREARIVGGGLDVVVGRHGLAEALARRPTALISFGVCGALDPTLKVGDLVVGSGVFMDGVRIAADEAWVERLIAALPGARRGDFASGGAIVGDVAAKAALRRETGASAVDMESHLVAGSGLPFAVLRAVSDHADRDLPRSARAAFRSDGGVDVGAVFLALMASPAELPQLVHTAIEAGRAFRALKGARGVLISSQSAGASGDSVAGGGR